MARKLGRTKGRRKPAGVEAAKAIARAYENDEAKAQRGAIMPPCARCDRPMRDHYSLTFTDGVVVSGEVLVCPTAVYQARHA